MFTWHPSFSVWFRLYIVQHIFQFQILFVLPSLTYTTRSKTKECFITHHRELSRIFQPEGTDHHTQSPNKISLQWNNLVECKCFEERMCVKMLLTQVFCSLKRYESVVVFVRIYDELNYLHAYCCFPLS